MRRAAAALFALVVVTWLLGLPALPRADAQSAATAAAPVHGLTGYYYTRDVPGSYTLQGFLSDAYGIPVPNKEPNASRVDPQIAFGKGKGFVLDAAGAQQVWWEPAGARAVVWKGYIRLPVPGSYSLTTASSGASAVYLNSARVSLNGGFGGSVPSETFSLGETGTDAAYSPTHGQYVVPIAVPVAPVLPIEVRYLVQDSKGAARGIDLYWVRPDAPRDASGTPVAEIVPTDALFTTPPDPVTPSIVSGPHSTMTSDVLYLPDGGTDVATLTIRVADTAGRPVAGKHVAVSSVQFATVERAAGDWRLVQPQAPTDAQGLTTARFTMTATHNRRFFATVLDDAVAVGQDVEILGQRGPLAFLPLTYSPYYGGQHFLVTPLPLTVGQLATIGVPLMNRKPVPYEVSVRVLATIPNIGAYNFGEIGRTETFVLQPGESREVKVGWTPTEAGGKLCFNIQVWGRPAPPPTTALRRFTLVPVAFAQAPVPAPVPTPPMLMHSRQHNIGTVSPSPFAATHCGVTAHKPGDKGPFFEGRERIR